MPESNTTNDKTKQDTITDSYDEVPYTSHPYPETHPNKLASTAILFGMTPPGIDNCRLLELGCGSGNNLIGMASELPNSEFVGIDLSKNEVALANEKINALQMKNIQITQMSITDIKPDFGTFDYIIAHGVYSWVPEHVRDHLLCICRDNLTKNGVAYISYNTYPGWHMQEMFRKIMRYHVKDIKDPMQATQEAKQFAKFLAESNKQQTPYMAVMRSEIDRIKNYPDYYVYHDYLEENNQPFYFYEFANDIEKHGMKYLRECDIQVSTSLNFSPQFSEMLNNLGDNIIEIEQHIDFILGRTFRETLICHQDVQLNRTVTPDDIVTLYFSSSLFPENASAATSGNEELFISKKCPPIKISDVFAKTLWSFMAEKSPKPLDVDVILSGTVDLLKMNGTNPSAYPAEKEIRTHILANLLWGISMGFIQTYTIPTRVIVDISSKPIVSALTRYDASNGVRVINELHADTPIDNLSHHILPLLDGSHDIDAVIEKLIDLHNVGKINIKKEDMTVTDHQELKSILKSQTEFMLKKFAKLGLLIG